MTTTVEIGRGAIRVSSLTKTYPGPTRDLKVLDNISVSAERGSYIALRGVSGSGKSTLLNILGGIEVFDSGKVEVSGANLSTLLRKQRTAFRARTIGFIFQFFNLLPTLTALENVSAALEPLGKAIAERREQSMAMLDAVGIAHLANNFPAQMSGGEQQRVSIARAMVKRPPVILADEPTGALDRKNATQILDCLTRLQQQIGTTIVVATHDPIVISYATETWEIGDGVIEVSHS
ncbi:ABC transporter ATP-binding protein [Propionibacterium acidifaciens]|uniref:ABC transporter ATP-binding protein n=1 Tax=Propionibacterium acidifaciens TaxID=556499 RepID=UPI00048B579C|nr:ABC transporter ATP-binding protein [Propionibacterium acidifaciens]